MKRDQLYNLTEERDLAWNNIDGNMCEQIKEFTDRIYYECELRGELLSDEEVVDMIVVLTYDLLRYTKDYDGM